MAFKVFLSYGTDPNEQVAAWRLQTLAAAHGIHLSVPQRNGTLPTRRSHLPPDDARQAIDQSDCILAIISGGVGPDVEAELNYALTKKKLIVPILQEHMAQPAFLKKFPQTFQFNSWNRAQIEAAVVDFLKHQRLSKDRQQTLGALIAIGLGLVALLALAEK
jgi:hypothetical protein